MWLSVIWQLLKQSSLWVRLERGSRGRRGSRFVPVIYLSGVCTPAAHRAPAVWLCRLDVSASCSAEPHQRPLTQQNHYPSAILHQGYLRTSQIHSQTRMYRWTRRLGGNAPLWFNRACHICGFVQITKKNEQSQYCEVKLLYFIALITWNEPPNHITIVLFRRAWQLGVV